MHLIREFCAPNQRNQREIHFIPGSKHRYPKLRHHPRMGNMIKRVIITHTAHSYMLNDGPGYLFPYNQLARQNSNIVQVNGIKINPRREFISLDLDARFK